MEDGNVASPWYSTALEDLLGKGIIAGSAIFDKNGTLVFNCGILSADQVGTNEATQFLHLFDVDEEKITREFNLLKKKFFVFQTSKCSAYSITKSRTYGLIVNNLPFGVMLSVWKKPKLAQQVIPAVEDIADVLRL